MGRPPRSITGAVMAGLIFGIISTADGSDAGPLVVVPVDIDGVQRTTMIVDSYSYTPSHLQVEVGKPVELILKSVTLITPHNFVLKEPSAGLMVEVDVPSGKGTIIRFTPTQSGVFPFYCDKQLLFFKSHRERGMEGILDVR